MGTTSGCRWTAGPLERSARSNATGGLGGVPDALATDPNVFIYDNYPGGIGFSRPLYEMHATAARADARADRRVSVRVGLSVVRRARRQHRPARQAGGVAHSRTAARGRGGVMDLSSRLRAIVKGGPPKPLRELTLRAGHRRVRSGHGPVARGGDPRRPAGHETAFGAVADLDQSTARAGRPIRSTTPFGRA